MKKQLHGDTQHGKLHHMVQSKVDKKLICELLPLSLSTNSVTKWQDFVDKDSKIIH